MEIFIANKPLHIEITARAEAALAARQRPLLAEMELYFSCLVRKRVRFYDASERPEHATIPVDERLQVRFRPVMTQSCSVSDVEDGEPPLSDFPISKPDAFIPHWLRIDYHNEQWQGEFGYGQ